MIFKKNKIIKIIVLLIFIGNSSVINAASQKAIGKVIASQGNVYLQNGAGKKALTRNSNIYLNDKIVTETNSKVQVQFNDGSLTSLQQNSKFYISDFTFDRNTPEKGSYVGNLERGAIINISGQKKSKNYQLNNLFAKVAAEGTTSLIKINKVNGVVANADVVVVRGRARVTSICSIDACIPRRLDLGKGQVMNAINVDNIGRIKVKYHQGVLGPYPYNNNQLDILQMRQLNINDSTMMTNELLNIDHGLPSLPEIPQPAPIIPDPGGCGGC